MTAIVTSNATAPAEDAFIISDLHIGGKYGNAPEDRGFRINTHVEDLTGFLTEVRERAAKRRRRTELVINGDFVDFLAEGGPEGTAASSARRAARGRLSVFRMCRRSS